MERIVRRSSKEIWILILLKKVETLLNTLNIIFRKQKQKVIL
jgi:hypothetical protein